MENNKISGTFKIKTIISTFIIILISFPWYKLNIIWPSYMFVGKIIIELNYLIALVLLISYLIIYYIYYNKSNMALNNINNKILINGVLISFAYNHNISILIPIIIVINSIMSLYLKNKINHLDRISDIIMYIGIVFVLIGNLPFEFLNLAVDQGLIIIASCFSIYSSVINISTNKNKLKEDNN